MPGTFYRTTLRYVQENNVLHGFQLFLSGLKTEIFKTCWLKLPWNIKPIKLLDKLNNALKRSTVQAYNITFMKLRSVAMVHSRGNFHYRRNNCRVPNLHSKCVLCKAKEQEREWLLRKRFMGQLSRNKLRAATFSLSSDESVTEVVAFRHRVQIPSRSSEGVPKSYHARSRDV
jgi:hypothetical protein